MKTNIDVMATFVQDKYEQWQTARTTKENKWDKHYRTWRCVESAEDKTRNMERSTIKIPATKNAIDSAHDHIFMTLFGKEPFFNIAGRQLDDEVRAVLVKQYLQFLFHKEKFPSKFSQFVREMLIYGTAIARVKVNTISEKSIVFDGDEESFAVDELNINRPVFEPISIFNFFINPSARDIQSSEGNIVRSYHRSDQLKKLQRSGVIQRVGMLEEEKNPVQMNDSMRRRLEASGIYPQSTDNSFEVLDWWGWVPEDVLEEAGYDGEVQDGGAEVFAIASQGTTLKMVPNPFYTQERPFLSDCYETIPDEFYGMGVSDITEGAQRALDATVRSRLDNKALAINQIFGINVKKLVAGQSLDLYAGKKFLVDGNVKEAIQQFKVDDVTSGSYHEAIEYERYIQEGSGISKMLGGQPVKRGEMSATESSAMMQQQSGRIKAVVRSLEDNVVKEVLRWYYQITLQFLDVPEMIKVQNTQGNNGIFWIMPEDIVGDYDFIPQGTPSMQTQDQLGKTLQFLQVTANPVDVQMVNRPFLIKKVYELMGFNDAEKVVTGMPQQQAIQNSQGMSGAGSIPAERGQPAPPITGGGGVIGQ